MYATKTIKLSTNHKINIFIKHRSLSIGKDYLFKSIFHVNMTTFEFIIAIQTIVKDHQNVISINNFELRLTKILKNQIFERLFTLSRNAQSIKINFVFADVFAEKTNVESNMFFIIQFSNEIANNKIDISNHWNQKYRFKMQKILNRHNKLFNNDLNKFNDDIEMLIFFRNEIDILDFKQNSYFFIARNKKVMNEILDSLMKQKRIQKILLETSSFAFSSIFVVWKNDKPRIVINFKKINTRFYSDVYFLSRQNTILKTLSDFIIFSSIDLIKSFFQQNIRQQNWWKIIFVTFYREQKWLTIFIMNFVNTSDFF